MLTPDYALTKNILLLLLLMQLFLQVIKWVKESGSWPIQRGLCALATFLYILGAK